MNGLSICEAIVKAGITATARREEMLENSGTGTVSGLTSAYNNMAEYAWTIPDRMNSSGRTLGSADHESGDVNRASEANGMLPGGGFVGLLVTLVVLVVAGMMMAMKIAH